MKPIVKYRGGKTKELHNYLHYISEEQFDIYYEPFVGGGATYFELEPQRAVINDINTKLIDFYNDVKLNYTRLKEELADLQQIYTDNQLEYERLKLLNPNERVPNANEELYYSMRQEFNYPTGRYLDGTIYYFINKTAYSGMIRYNRIGEYNVPYGRYKNFNTNLLNENHHELLLDTQIMNTDYSQIFELATPRDIMFLDPPYDCVFNDYGNLELEEGFNEDEHRRLAKNFRNLNTRALMVISKTRLTEELYRNYIVDEYDKNYSVNIRNRFKNSAVHIVIKNY